MPAAQPPDVTEMLAVHQALRDTLAGAPQLVGSVSADDLARIELIANLYDNVLDFLHSHHDGEDELVFPVLRARCPEQDELITRIGSQHADVYDLVARSIEALSAWRAGEQSAQDTCGATLGALGGRLLEHLDDEEQDLLPLCADHMTSEEWAMLPGHAMASFAGDKIWLILGLIRDRMTQVQRDQMLATLPPPAVEMWTGFGEQAYRQLISEVGAPLA
jgi:hemerythrin-like domain-containing protein